MRRSTGRPSLERIGAFESPEMRHRALLPPHPRGAARIGMRRAPSGAAPESAAEALDRLNQAVLITDAEARVIHANRAGEAVVATGGGLGIESRGPWRRLRAATPDRTRALRRAIEQATAPEAGARSGGFVLRLPSESGCAVLASVTRLCPDLAWTITRRPTALVLLSPTDQDVSPRPEHLRALYGLTPAEIAVASRIMRGDGLAAAARALHIAPATLHTHMSRIFDKTETSRQAELVRLLQQVARLRTR